MLIFNAYLVPKLNDGITHKINSVDFVQNHVLSKVFMKNFKCLVTFYRHFFSKVMFSKKLISTTLPTFWTFSEKLFVVVKVIKREEKNRVYTHLFSEIGSYQKSVKSFLLKTICLYLWVCAMNNLIFQKMFSKVNIWMTPKGYFNCIHQKPRMKTYGFSKRSKKQGMFETFIKKFIELFCPN